MAATTNFRLDTTTFTAGGSMDDSGKCQIVKRFLYDIVDNSPEARRRSILELETLVPVKGSCMSDDARYTLKSAVWNCLDWRNQSTKFFIDATYRRISDDDAASAPWNLAPFNIVTSAVEQEIPFRLAYNSKNQRCIPVVNGAGDPIDATTREVLPQHAFSFYAKSYDIGNIVDYSNSINKSAQRILGQRYAAGTLFLMPFNVSCLVTYEDDGYTEKWKYYQVDMCIRYNAEGWQRTMLNVGNRARFGSTKAPEVIYQYYKFSNGSFATTPVWTDAKTYHAHDAAYRTWLSTHKSAAQSLPAHVPYEFGENIPLTSGGAVNTSVLNTDITAANYSGYPSRQFNEFRTLSWSGLDIPSEVKKRWRS